MSNHKQLVNVITGFLMGHTYVPRTDRLALIELRRDLETVSDGDAYLGDVEAVIGELATFNITALARLISEALSVKEPEEYAVSECPNKSNHGGKFWHCSTCDWTEDDDPGVPRPVSGRHPDVEHLLSLFEYKHLPLHLQHVSSPFSVVVHAMVRRLDYGTELLVGMRKLLEAKDCMVRQAVIDANTAPE